MTDQPDAPSCLLRAAEIAAQAEVRLRHPLNPNSDVALRRLSDLTGLTRAVLHLARVPPGKESFVVHRHLGEEEFVYILQGRGMARIGDAEVEVGPGDFMGFPAGGPAHHLRNPFDADLVYLMGGERLPTEVGEFPELGKYVIRAGGRYFFVDGAVMQEVRMEDFLRDGPKAD